MRYAIPTYQRTELLRDKTLAYLAWSAVSPADVLILVANEREEEAYARVLDDVDGAWTERIFITGPGLCGSRKQARESYLEAGEEVIWIDDDVEGVYRRRDAKKADKVPVQEVASEGFGICRTLGGFLWGIYPTLNPFYMKEKVRAGLWHVVGCFYGQVIQQDPAWDSSMGDAKEDYERTLRHWEQDGFVVRLDMYAPKTSYYRADQGGISNRTAASVMQNVDLLKARWPGKVTLNPRRKSGFPEILLKEQG